MLIPDAFLTTEIRETDDFKEYETVFIKVAVPMNQPQPIVSTQGTNRNTPIAHRSPTASVNPSETKKRKQTAGESSSLRKSLKITIKQKQIINKDDDDYKIRIEPGSHKENPKFVNIVMIGRSRETKNDDMGALRRMCRRQGYMIQDMERKCVTTEKIWETHNKIDDILHKVVPKIAENATNDLIEYNLKPCIANTIIEDHDAFRSEVPALVSQKFNAHAPAIIEGLFKSYVQFNVVHVHPTTTTSTKTESSADLQYQLYLKLKRNLQDRANDIVLWEALKPKGEKSEKKKKVKKIKEEENVIDEDNEIPEDVAPKLIAESQNVDKRILTIFDRARMEATLKDSLGNQFRNAEEYAYHLEQSTNFMENQIVWESRQQDIPRTIPKTLIFYGSQRNPNEPPRYLYNKDLFYFKYGNTEERKYILSLYKIRAEEFLDPNLEQKLNRWVREEFQTFNEDAWLSIQHWKDSWHKRVLKGVKLRMFDSQFLKKPPLLGELDQDIRKRNFQTSKSPTANEKMGIFCE
ncbi:hypothetical protein Tco_0639043 [Tanacetum coccineum]